MTTIFNRGKLPAGTYYVGDLCYVINDDDWSDFCDRSFPDAYTEVIGIQETNEGINYANFGTKYGDGVYTDYHGRRYAVDSGSIGCIPVCALGDKYDLEKVKSLGNIISFDEPFDVYYEESTGTIQFGEVEIMTGEYEEYEDEDDGYIGYGEPEDAE